MGEKVSFQVTSLIKGSSACRAFVRRFLQVQCLVDRQSSGLTEALPALLTLEGFLLRVDISVVPQVVLSPEGLVADVAGVGPLVGVCALVDQQVVGFGEVSPAEPADELLLALGRESAARRSALRAQSALSGHRRVLLRRRHRQIGEVEARPVLPVHRVFVRQQMRGGGGERECAGEARVRQALQLREAHRPPVHLYGVERAEAVQLIHRHRERVQGLQERVVELQRRVERHRSRESLTAHSRCRSLGAEGRGLTVNPHRARNFSSEA